jgi:methylated-DNA-[protein]-cysteine S-methyltransferase
MAKGGGQKMSEAVKTWHAITVQALKSALQGHQPDNLPELDFSSGTEFQKQVWRALCEIRAGQTLSYGGVAERIGNPKAVRAVGGACGANPIPVLVPCHRVIAANDSLGGFSADMKWKRILLSREGVRLSGL